jgi:hypothetical protein
MWPTEILVRPRNVTIFGGENGGGPWSKALVRHEADAGLALVEVLG